MKNLQKSSNMSIYSKIILHMPCNDIIVCSKYAYFTMRIFAFEFARVLKNTHYFYQWNTRLVTRFWRCLFRRYYSMVCNKIWNPIPFLTGGAGCLLFKVGLLTGDLSGREGAEKCN